VAYPAASSLLQLSLLPSPRCGSRNGHNEVIKVLVAAWATLHGGFRDEGVRNGLSGGGLASPQLLVTLPGVGTGKPVEPVYSPIPKPVKEEKTTFGFASALSSGAKPATPKTPTKQPPLPSLTPTSPEEAALGRPVAAARKKGFTRFQPMEEAVAGGHLQTVRATMRIPYMRL